MNPLESSQYNARMSGGRQRGSEHEIRTSVNRFAPQAMLADRYRITTPDASHRPNSKVELRVSAVRCPFCRSESTHLESPFGPTRCRMIFYCDDCKNSFEHMKRV